MKVVFHHTAGPRLMARLAALTADDLKVTVCPEADRARFDKLMRHADALWHVLEPVSGETIAHATSLRLIQKIGVGVNTIDLEAARRRGIAVCNMPGTNSQAVAEMTLLLVLSTLRQLNRLDRATRAGGGWDLPPSWQDHSLELGGRTVGLVGFGAVPRRLAPMLRAVGARVLHTSRQPRAEAHSEPRTLNALLPESDIVSLHVPLTADTEGLIDATAIAKMRPGAILINTARGPLVDEAALVSALRTGRLGAAGLDVFAVEPPPPGNPLLTLDRVVVTPHVAWLTQETLERSLDVAKENCRRLHAGEPLLHRVI